MASRRKARELALQMLFQWEMGRHEAAHVLKTSFGGRRIPESAEQFARSLFEGTVAETPALDRLITDHAEHWRLERMAAVDRNLLRLALYELIHHPETPPAVVIDEAIEIARRFSGEESVEFVNGVLDALRKSLAAAKTQP
jgi:N utilization substance protein B